VFATEKQTGAFSVLLHAPLWDVVADRRYGIYVTEQSGPATLLPAGRPTGGSLPSTGSRARGRSHRPQTICCSPGSDRSASVPDLPVRIVATNHFSFSAAIAERFRIGDAFLDAAHRVTPPRWNRDEQRHGFNLGWKLAWRLNGWAGDALVDSYESERRPVAEHNLIRSLDPMGARRDPRDE